MNLDLARALVATLPVGLPNLFNPWREACSDDTEFNTPEIRIARLAEHLDCRPRMILCGEAPGHLGCRSSGVAFTCEEQLLAGAIPRVSRPDGRLSTAPKPLREQSARVVWSALYKHGLENEVVLWNALQAHPHAPGAPFTNRTPTGAEFNHGKPAIGLLREAFPDAVFVAIGRKAEALLAEAGLKDVSAVRHPARGGEKLFNSGLAELAR
ncbi:uracil-DNA glycosylase [Pseudomonas sp. NCHU5208]|uniref:uracil-DNA glycosylase n=1 Tax=unclassified Pseudomonas TaxID=196821 RepID=UPI003F9891B4